MENLGFGQNPYVDAQANSMTTQAGNYLSKFALPNIASGAMMAGGYGGSRQGVAEANAIQGGAQSLTSGLAQLYNGAYGQDQNFYTNQRSLDQSGAQLGANLYGGGNSGYLSQGQGLYNVGNQTQQAPWNSINSYSNNLSPYTGLGSTQLNTQQGSLVGNVAGGALAGGQLGKMFSNTSSTPSQMGGQAGVYNLGLSNPNYYDYTPSF